MIKKFLSYIAFFIVLSVGAVSCSDELIGPDAPGQYREYKGTISFDLSTPDVADRTRSVNMESGANILINNLWIGVFDATTGQCFGAMKNDALNASMVSGTVMKDLLSVDFIARGERVPLAYIIAVANYDGVTTWDNQPLTDLLPDFDHRSEITWDKIIGFGIDTASAYKGNKGEDDNSNAPFMAGFFQDATSLTQNPKIDQFAYNELGPAALYPAAAASGMDIQLGNASDDKVYVAAGAICLRRLVSQNVLRFNMYNDYELTSVEYKRFNMPRSVFMLQRRTDTNRYSNFEDWQRNSPNFADHLLTEGNYDPDDLAFPYESDREWNRVDVNSWDNAGAIEVAFDHFENKHWGFGNLTSQNDREALNPDGTFAALCSGNGDAYNNFASYFKLRLHLINKSTGESADVEYTLHEGFCNTDDGRRAETLEQKCHDFGSFRNVNYTYNINISGINDITANVTSDEGKHPNGQSGKIWKMNYATGSGKDAVPIAGGEYDFNGKYMTFGENALLGFRIYGVDAKEQTVDICYNMTDDMLLGFSGLWPSGTPKVISAPDAADIPASMAEGMKITGPGGASYTVTDFVKGINGGTLNPTANYSVRFTAYDGKAQGLNGNHMRGIYIFDRNDSRNATDADGCSQYIVAYGAEQYPFNMEVLDFDIYDKVVWDNVYYKSVSKVKELRAAATRIFYGAECSAIDMRWKHDARIDGYKITVYNANYTHPVIIVGPDKINQYLQTVNGETLFIYPLSTASFPRNTSTGALNYSFTVEPIVDEERYTVEGNTKVEHNKYGDDSTCIRVCPTIWNLGKNGGTNDWKNLLPIKGFESLEVFYRGLHTISTTAIGDYPSTDFLCFGGKGSVENRYFSFVASVPGKIAVNCKSHTTDDVTRQIIIARLSENGSQTLSGISYDIVYQSNSMPAKQTTFTSGLLQLNGSNEPTEFRIYAGGSIDYYSIQFIPN